MLFMICRKDAVDRNIKTSELFPVIVEYPEDTPHDIIVEETLHKKWAGYFPKDKAYYCIPMGDASLVSFRPIPQPKYDVIVQRLSDGIYYER